jgi:hypothetical protein
MNTAIPSPSLVASTVAAAGFSTRTASAREPAPLSGSEVKAETRAAQKAHELLPAGEAATTIEKPIKSIKTRSERKAETLAARKAGDLLPAGEKQGRPIPFHSEKTRAQRKSETLAAAKAKKLIPAGESIDLSKK